MHFISAVCSERGAMVREWVSKTTLTKMSSHHREEAVHHHQMPLLVCFVLLSVAQEASHFSECMSNVWQVFLLPFVDSGKYPSWNSLEILYFLPPFEARIHSSFFSLFLSWDWDLRQLKATANDALLLLWSIETLTWNFYDFEVAFGGERRFLRVRRGTAACSSSTSRARGSFIKTVFL